MVLHVVNSTITLIDDNNIFITVQTVAPNQTHRFDTCGLFAFFWRQNFNTESNCCDIRQSSRIDLTEEFTNTEFVALQLRTNGRMDERRKRIIWCAGGSPLYIFLPIYAVNNTLFTGTYQHIWHVCITMMDFLQQILWYFSWLQTFYLKNFYGLRIKCYQKAREQCLCRQDCLIFLPSCTTRSFCLVECNYRAIWNAGLIADKLRARHRHRFEILRQYNYNWHLIITILLP